MRELDHWAAERAALDLRHLGSGYHSAEIWFERWPWPFPVPVRRRMVQHLVDIHDHWLTRLSRLEEPFYLGIWLFEPGVAESQVVAAVDWRADEYRARHDPAQHSAPPPLYQGHPYDLGRFAWTRRRWVRREWLSSFAGEDRPWALRHARSAERAEGDVALTFEHEDWFGMLPDRS